MHSLFPLKSSALPCRFIPPPPCFVGGGAYFDGTELENMLRCVSMAAADREASAAAADVLPTCRKIASLYAVYVSLPLTRRRCLAEVVLIYRAASGLKSSERCSLKPLHPRPRSALSLSPSTKFLQTATAVRFCCSLSSAKPLHPKESRGMAMASPSSRVPWMLVEGTPDGVKEEEFSKRSVFGLWCQHSGS